MGRSFGKPDFNIYAHNFEVIADNFTLTFYHTGFDAGTSYTYLLRGRK